MLGNISKHHIEGAHPRALPACVAGSSRQDSLCSSPTATLCCGQPAAFLGCSSDQFIPTQPFFFFIYGRPLNHANAGGKRKRTHFFCWSNQWLLLTRLPKCPGTQPSSSCSPLISNLQTSFSNTTLLIPEQTCLEAGNTQFKTTGRISEHNKYSHDKYT